MKLWVSRSSSKLEHDIASSDSDLQMPIFLTQRSFVQAPNTCASFVHYRAFPKKVKQVLIKRINRNLNQPKVKVKIAEKKTVEPWYKTIKKIGIK